MFCIAFGLSMDYEVFMLSRIKEEHDRTGQNVPSVATGLERTGRILTAAALLLAVVFLAFATSQVTFIKLFGIGLAMAILVDATLVRGVLVPAFMRLAGDANWWAPAPLRRLYLRIGLSDSEPGIRDPRGARSARASWRRSPDRGPHRLACRSAGPSCALGRFDVLDHLARTGRANDDRRHLGLSRQPAQAPVPQGVYPESRPYASRLGHDAKGLFGRLPMKVLGPGQAAPYGKRLFSAVLAGQHARRQWEIGDDCRGRNAGTPEPRPVRSPGAEDSTRFG